MDAPEGDPREESTREESIGDLVSRLVDDARAYAEAEVELYKAIAIHRGERARKALVMLAIGWFLLFAAMTAVVIAAMVSLTQAVGVLLAGVLVGLPLAAIGYGLVHFGWEVVKSLGRDAPEREALERGESAP